MTRDRDAVRDSGDAPGAGSDGEGVAETADGEGVADGSGGRRSRSVVDGAIRANRRASRAARRRIAAARRWLETTENLIHVSVLALVPLLVALVTAVSNALAELSFLLFPPLASGAYTLFSDPEGEYAHPGRFVVGLTVGALAGWFSLIVAPGNGALVAPAAAGLSIVLVALVTWGLGVVEPVAFSTALLVLVTDEASPEAYVISVAVFGSLVAIAFVLWRDYVYERRAEFLYGTVHADDHVLVPFTDAVDESVATFAGRLAAAHEAGKVVLLHVVDDEARAAAERELVDAMEHPDVAVDEATAAEVGAGEDAGGGDEPPWDRSDPAPADRPAGTDAPAVRAAAAPLESVASRLREELGVPCEVVVAAGDPTHATLRTVREANCDLVVQPLSDPPSSLVTDVFAADVDSLAVHAAGDRRAWSRVLVMVARPGDTAHAMIDFAERLAGGDGRISVCTCIDREADRRPAEEKLARLVETERIPMETRVVREDVESFVREEADGYDLVLVGASRGDGPLLQAVTLSAVERFGDADCDLAIVDRGPIG